MSNPNAEMKALADSLWNYFQPKVADATRSCLRMEKATVKAEVADHTTADRITALLRLGNHCCRCRMGRHSSLFV